MKRTVRLLVVALAVLVWVGPPAEAQVRRALEPGASLVYPFVIADANWETLIALTTLDTVFTDLAHFVFYDNGCNKLDRVETLTPLDTDVYVASAFALGPLVAGSSRGGALEVHSPFLGENDLFGSAYVVSFFLSAWSKYAATSRQFDTSGIAVGSVNHRVLAVDGLGILLPTVDNFIKLAVGPNQNQILFDTPAGLSPGLTTADFLIFNQKEEPHSSRKTYFCGLTLFLDEIDPIALAVNLPFQTNPSPQGNRFLEYPHLWVHILLTGPSDGAPGRSHYTTGLDFKSLVSGNFSTFAIDHFWHSACGLFGVVQAGEPACTVIGVPGAPSAAKQ